MHQSHRIQRPLAVLAQLLSCLLLIVAACTLHAQVAGTGTIQGVVADPTGAVIPGAAVTITEEETHVVQTVASDKQGVYIFPNIKVGTYTVSVAAPGFGNYTRTHNILEVGSNIAVNAKLAVGGGEASVTVQSEALALQTEDVKFKQTIDKDEVAELPLSSPGRQITGLLALAGGTSPAPGGDFTGSKYTYQTISVSVAGGMGNTTLWRLDGGDNNDYMANGNLPFPFPDAVSQFSVESSVLGAQDGMHSGGLVNVVTRSGTNKFHGNAFEFIRNNLINASNFFSKSKDVLHQHQFGGTFGGPIIRDKLFFFGGYQYLISHATSSSTTAYVPTAAMLSGDFSACNGSPTGSGGTGAVGASGTILQLYDPMTGAILPGNKYTTAPTYSKASLALVKYLPTQLISDGCGKVVYSIPNNQTDTEVPVRVDWTISPRHHFYARYFYDKYDLPAYFYPDNILVTTGAGQHQLVNTGTMGEDWTIRNNLVNSLHISVLRRVNNRGYASNDINANTLGISLYQYVPNGLQISAGRFTIGGGTNSVAHFNDNTLSIDDDVTWVLGKHTVVFGGEFVKNQLNISNSYESNGKFQFSTAGQYSGNGPNGGSKKGEPLLDFLAGALSSSGTTNAFEQSKFQQNALRAPIPSLYAQDTFHATPRMTMIAGVRWSPNIFPTDFFHRGSVFDPAAFLANQHSTVYPNAPAGTFYYGDAGVPASMTKNSWWQFSPNVGVSFDPKGDGKTVVRAGFELIYDQVNFFTGQRTQQNPPYATTVGQSTTSTSGPVLFDAPFSRGSVTTNPFPLPFLPTGTQAQYFPQTQYIVLPKQFHPSYTEQWTFSIQRQLGHGWQAQLDYIGNHTVHAPVGIPLNLATYVPGVWGAGGTGCTGVVTTGPGGQTPGAAGANCSSTSNYTARYKLTEQNPAQGNFYQGGGGGSTLVGDFAMANYNGLIATVQHRISNSFSVLTNYTWSRCMNIQDASGDYAGAGAQNPFNLAGDYGPCGSDYRNIFNFVVVATSHVHFGNQLSRQMLSNWEISPLFHATSGAPFNVTDGVDISLTNTGNDRPNLVAGQPVYLHQAIQGGSSAANITTRGYLNPAAFSYTTVPSGTFGSVSRNAFRGPAYYQFDAQVSRIFPIHESIAAQLRLECFNVLNHPTFSNPSSSVSGSTFGQVSSTTGEGPRVFQGSVKVSF
ncbi:MAG: carboxypeptidase-like regulatory domain-containing protein [Acidobacteriota bacterium]